MFGPDYPRQPWPAALVRINDGQGYPRAVPAAGEMLVCYGAQRPDCVARE